MAKGKGNGAGKPTVITPKVLAILDQAWIGRATVEEAALLAGISPDAIYNYKRKNPEYNKKIEQLKNLTNLKAKININDAIDKGDKDISKWHLERRDPEYKPKSTQEHSGKIESGATVDQIKAVSDGVITALAKLKKQVI